MSAEPSGEPANAQATSASVIPPDAHLSNVVQFEPAKIPSLLMRMHAHDDGKVILFHFDRQGRRAGVATAPSHSNAQIARAFREATAAADDQVFAMLPISSGDHVAGVRLAFKETSIAREYANKLDPTFVIRSAGGVSLVYLWHAHKDARALVAEMQAVWEGRDDRYVAIDFPLPSEEFALTPEDQAVIDAGEALTVYTLAEFEAAMFTFDDDDPAGGLSEDATEADRVTTSIEDALAAGKPFFDATVIGEIVPGVLDHRFVGSKLHSQTDWKAENVFGDVRSLYRHVAEHKVSDDKKGPGITACHLATDKETGKPRRKKRNVETNGAFMFDFDGGQTTDEILGKFEALKATFGAYSSYNHLKTEGVHKLRVILPFEKPFVPDAYGDRESPPHPDTCHAVAQVLKKQGLTRPEWLTAVVQRGLADQEAGK